MEHVFWLIPGRLAGRAGPATQAWSLQELRAGGFDAVLNLSEVEPSPEEFSAAGLAVAWIPLPNIYIADAGVETDCQESLPKTFAFIRDHLAADRRVLVHCAWGQDRTGLALAYYLARASGMPAEAAIAQVRTIRPKAITAPGWEPMTHRLLNRLSDVSRSSDLADSGA